MTRRQNPSPPTAATHPLSPCPAAAIARRQKPRGASGLRQQGQPPPPTPAAPRLGVRRWLTRDGVARGRVSSAAEAGSDPPATGPGVATTGFDGRRRWGGGGGRCAVGVGDKAMEAGNLWPIQPIQYDLISTWA